MQALTLSTHTTIYHSRHAIRVSKATNFFKALNVLHWDLCMETTEHLSLPKAIRESLNSKSCLRQGGEIMAERVVGRLCRRFLCPIGTAYSGCSCCCAASRARSLLCSYFPWMVFCIYFICCCISCIAAARSS